ncbi:putative bifunctional diguanylate cyclase/phosphodiesterase [Deinococcus rufus]|uniref:Bifunctional diguanylate cyclase/phosphodiesterase n=1 Tax=Deinococcus rufus TaxID=2136097 RepID=A0ABV7Z9N8_9DEIO
MTILARPPLLGIAIAVSVILHVTLGLWRPDGEVGVWWSDLIGIPPFLLAGLACLRVAAGPEGDGRAAWRAFGLGLLASAAGDLVWTYLELVRRVQPFPSVADVLYLSMPVAFVVGFLTVLRPGPSRPWRLRNVLDMAVVLGAAALISWRFIISAIVEMDGFAGQPVARVVALAYPALDLALLGLALLLTVQGSVLHRLRSGLVALGLVCIAVADSLFAYLGAHDAYGSGGVTDQFWSVGAALIGAAALRRVPPEAAGLPAAHPRWWAAAPYLAIGAVTALQFTTYGVRGPATVGVLIGGSVLTLLIVARQALSVRDNQRLTEALRNLSDGLEARVAERTEALRQQGAALDHANAALRALSQGLELKVIERTAALEASRAQLAYQAQHDALTSLPNRTVLEDRLTQAANAASRYGGLTAVMFIDLDGFKFVNDTFGHVAGDAVLLEVGRRLQDCVRSADTVARLGGDEFVVLLTHVGHVTDVRAVAQRIVSRLARPIALAGQDVSITASVGVALYPDDAHTPQQLLGNADVAMYAAKQRGKNTVQFYAPSMNLAAQRRSLVERQLRGALACGAFTLHYQPQHDAAGAVCAFEALLR